MAAVVLVVSSSELSAAVDDFVGSKKCGSCHPAELQAWRSGPHAGAGRSIAAASTSACLSCHTTGAAPVGRVAERAVGCEACHGPGRGYSPRDVMKDPPLSRALGLVDLRAAGERERVCKSCHRGATKLRPPSLEAGWKRFGHGRRVR
jgi:hypothetical protein